MLGRKVYMNFVAFLNPMENFAYSICGLLHNGSQLHEYFPNQSLLDENHPIYSMYYANVAFGKKKHDLSMAIYLVL